MRKISFPSCYIEITPHCNLKCLHCYNDSDSYKEPLTLAALKNTMKAFIKLGGSHVSLSGGEPLMHPGIYELIEYNHKLGLKTDITTNGTMLNLLQEDTIKQIDGFQISLDGATAETQQKIRGVDCFGVITENIRQLLSGFPYVSDKIALKMVINKLNKNEIESFIELAKELKVNDVRFAFMLITGRAANVEYLSLDVHEKIETMQLVNKLVTDNSAMHISQLGTTDVCPYTKNEDEILVNTRIDYSGNVYPCQSISHEHYCLGNINFQSLETILAHEKIESFLSEMRERQTKISACQKCVWSRQCRGGCIGTSFFKGSLYEPDQDCLLRKSIYNNAIRESLKNG